MLSFDAVTELRGETIVFKDRCVKRYKIYIFYIVLSMKYEDAYTHTSQMHFSTCMFVGDAIMYSRLMQ